MTLRPPRPVIAGDPRVVGASAPLQTEELLSSKGETRV